MRKARKQDPAIGSPFGRLTTVGPSFHDDLGGRLIHVFCACAPKRVFDVRFYSLLLGKIRECGACRSATVIAARRERHSRRALAF